MYHSIVVPLDGSSFGEHALPYATALARASGAHLRLVHVHVRPVHSDTMAGLTPYSFESMPRYRELDDAETRLHENEYLEHLAERLGSVCDVRTSFKLLNGDVEEALAYELGHDECDLVVMATHGRGSFARFWHGSVAHEIVRTSSVPILLVPAGEDEVDVTSEKRLHKILVPLDGSTLAEQALASAINLADAFGAELTLLTVIPALGSHIITPVLHPGLSNGNAFNLPEYLARMVTQLGDAGVRAEMKLCVNPHPAWAILDCAAVHSMDVIAIATHGRTGFSRLIFGSVADQVVKSAAVPVLVQPPRRPRASVS